MLVNIGISNRAISCRQETVFQEAIGPQRMMRAEASRCEHKPRRRRVDRREPMLHERQALRRDECELLVGDRRCHGRVKRVRRERGRRRHAGARGPQTQPQGCGRRVHGRRSRRAVVWRRRGDRRWRGRCRRPARLLVLALLAFALHSLRTQRPGRVLGDVRP